MKIAIVFGVVAFAMSTVASEDFSDGIEEEWNLFKSTYNKSYGGDDEEVLRKKIYLENQLKIVSHNKRYKNGEVSYTMGMNQFGDLTAEEFLEKMTGGYNPNLDDMDRNGTFVKYENVNVPSYVNWVKKGYVTPVKSQGQCGGCWSFSATGSLEGQHFKKHGRLVSFSEQNLMDCTWSYGNNGCHGGNTYMALKYVMDNGGIDTESSYPYTGKSSHQCLYSRQNRGTAVRDCRKVDAGDGNLLAAVATVGPVSVSIQVIHSFHLYKNGIYSDQSCGVQTNHAVLAVGYGVTRDGSRYWILKNSWDTHWGYKGYMYMTRDVPNMCGVSDHPSYPVV